jgi:hypothetical protein
MAYFAQVHSDPTQTIKHFSSFYTVCQMFTTLTDEPAQMFQMFAPDERERGRFHSRLWPAWNARCRRRRRRRRSGRIWREAMQHTWREYAGAAGGDVLRLALANDAFRRIAKVRGSCLSM